MKKLIAACLCLALIVSFCACGSEAENVHTGETRLYTDSAGREVEIPAHINKVAVTGPLAQIFCYAVCPELLVGIPAPWTDTAKKYVLPEYASLPVLGQLYGGKGDINPESLLQSGAEIVIDVGQTKEKVASDLDALTEQTGIPFVHIVFSSDDMGTTFRLLGELLNRAEQTGKMADYCDEVYRSTMTMMETVEKKSVLYVLCDGQNVIAENSYFAYVLDLMAENLAVVDTIASNGDGNLVDMEQIYMWNPDVLVFGPDSVYDQIADDPLWQNMNAVKNGRFYEVPNGPYNWMGFPPAIQNVLGMLWFGKLLYPEACGYDLYEEVKAFFSLFYHWELTEEQFNDLMKNSL